MAGIEKICEYSGEYPGWDMYTYKRNLIQIMPKYRKLFRGKPAVLFWFTVPDKDFTIQGRHGHKIFHVASYDYVLYVPDLPGNVNGYYWNWTTDRSATRRKLKRLLRKYKGLREVKIPMNVETWSKLHNNNEELLLSMV